MLFHSNRLSRAEIPLQVESTCLAFYFQAGIARIEGRPDFESTFWLASYCLIFRKRGGNFCASYMGMLSDGMKMSMSIFRSQQVSTCRLSAWCDFCGFSNSFAFKPKKGGGLKKLLEKIFGLL